MSHGGLLGTSRPCHYAILLDESKMPPDVIQRLTYNLAYIYARSTRSCVFSCCALVLADIQLFSYRVSIVSPAYYAHHVATRARAHLGGDDDDATTVISSASSGRDAEMRDQKLAQARERIRQIHANLEDSMYFMVSTRALSSRAPADTQIL